MDLNRDHWNGFVASSSEGSFLQSWEWGEVLKSEGQKIWRLTKIEQGQITGAALVTERKTPVGRWLYVPRGPVGVFLDKELRELGREEEAMFVRVEPSCTPPGWTGGESVQPRHTIVLDLESSEEELLSAMRQKTRYNIKLAERRGVRVRFSRNIEDVQAFLALAQEVSGRSAFRYHPAAHYEAMLKVLGAAGMMEIGVAEYEGKLLAAHLLVSFGGVTTYVHGASSSVQREVMAPHLLQWESIKRAKSRGDRQYDFYGVAPLQAGAGHPWAGITRFKEGFGGKRIEYVGAYDYMVKPLLYWLYGVVKQFRNS